MEKKIQRGDIITLQISNSAFEGKSVARLDNLVVFVEGGVPGDTVRARVQKVKKSHLEAKTLELVHPSEVRTEPRCIHFGVCGGCKWQHVKYDAQLKFKEQHVRDALERIGGFTDPPVLPIQGAEEIYFYRNKMEFSFSDQEWIAGDDWQKEDVGTGNEDVAGKTLFLGLHVPQRFDKVLDIKECHLPVRLQSGRDGQSPDSIQILDFVRSFAREHHLPSYSHKEHSGYFRFLVIRQSKRYQELLVNVVTFDERSEVMNLLTTELSRRIPEITTIVNTINSGKAQIATGEKEVIYLGNGIIREQLGGLTFSISSQSFFQTNTVQAEKLYSITKEFAALTGKEIVYDLYCGTGSIALYVADKAKQVIGIEAVESAVNDARKNADALKVKNCEFVLGDLKDRLTKEVDWMKNHSHPDVLIIDPPRSGMHPKVVEEIINLRVPRIVYVSCNPATQARDLKLLCDTTYRVKKIQPIDMFPHTYHVENVALLVR